MVTRNRILHFILILLALYITLTLIPITQAQEAVKYTVSQEWVHIWINKDGSIDIQYSITFTYLSGSPEGTFIVGMPKGGFRIDNATDLSGNDLHPTDVSEGDFYGIRVNLPTPIVLNRPYTIIVYAVVPGMIEKDKMNPGNVGMQFYPNTFVNITGSDVNVYVIGPIGNVRVRIDFPESVAETDKVYYLKGARFNGTIMDGNKYAGVYWERSNWPAAQEFWVGVSFPEKYVSLGPNIWFYVIIGASVLAVVTLMVVIFMRFRKVTYEKPRIAIEALGSARGLTAVEAAVVLELKPVRVLTMILFGLLLKRIVMVTATDPLIRLQRLERPVDESAPPLRYYEIDYLGALEPDGSLNDMKLARTFLELRDTVDLKLRGYSRVDTVNYYRSIVNNAWNQVRQAGTPELMGDAINQNIEWLLADDGFNEKIRIVFPPDVIIYPRPGWWWYWRGPHFPSGPTPVPPTTPTEARPIPGQDFANSIVLGLEKAANNMVKNVQDFTNRLIPVQTVTASERSVRSRSSCVCACAHCACACACVSCACACAHGGAR